MATIRKIGFGTIFELEDSKVGVGTDAATHTLQVLGILDQRTRLILVSLLSQLIKDLQTKKQDLQQDRLIINHNQDQHQVRL